MNYSPGQNACNHSANHRFKAASLRRSTPGRSQPRFKDSVKVRQSTIMRKYSAHSQISLTNHDRNATIDALLKFLAFGLPLLTLLSASIQAAF